MIVLVDRRSRSRRGVYVDHFKKCFVVHFTEQN